MAETLRAAFRIRVLVILTILIIVQPIESFDYDRNRNKNNNPGLIPGIMCKFPRNRILCTCYPSNVIVVEKVACYLEGGKFTSDYDEWKLFQTQATLKHLSITDRSNQRIDYFPVAAFAPLTEMKTFQIVDAKIYKIPYRAFSNLSELQSIHLSRNHIHILSKFSFANHRSLEEINLGENNIKEIQPDVFVGLPCIVKLNFYRNYIRVIHDGAFEDLGNLQALILDKNYLTVPTREMFFGLRKLEFLSMSDNRIDYVGDDVFAELGNLEHLKINKNSITELSERAFDGLDNLRELNLKRNNLMIIQRNTFTGTPALVSLNLAENQLETLTYGNIFPLMENLMNGTFHLMIEGNNFHCDCRMNWIYYLRNRTMFEPLKQELERIKCVWPKDIDEKEQLEMEENRNITVIIMIRSDYRKLPCPAVFNDLNELALSPYGEQHSKSLSIHSKNMNSCNSILVILTLCLLALY